MKRIALILIFLINLLYAEDLEDYTSSFDCSKEKKYTSAGLCDDIPVLNKQINELYKSFYFVTNEMKEDHKEWIKKTKECKEVPSCIRFSYLYRIDDLKESLKNEKTFPKNYLERMKQAQTDIRLKREKDSYNEREDNEFYEDFFRFKNIRFKEPLLSKVSYEDIKLKELLKECIGYRLDYEVYTENLPRFRENYPTLDFKNANVYLDFTLEERDSIKGKIKDAEYSVWKVYLDYKDWLFVGRLEKSTGIGNYFMVDPNYCTELKYDGNIGEALNKDKEFFKYGSGVGFIENYQIIDYKNRAYLIDENGSENDIRFRIRDILSPPALYKPMNVTGSTHTVIKFEIEKNR